MESIVAALFTELTVFLLFVQRHLLSERECACIIVHMPL